MKKSNFSTNKKIIPIKKIHIFNEELFILVNILVLSNN